MVPSYIWLEQQSDILMDNFLHGIPHRFTCPMTTARVGVWNNKKSFANNMGYQFPIYSSPASTMPMQGQFCKGVWRKLAVSGTGWVGRCVTSNPVLRFNFYREGNYTHMTLLHVSSNLGLIQMLEAALIAANIDETGCRNQKYGGEGPPSSEHYHFILPMLWGPGRYFQTNSLT